MGADRDQRVARQFGELLPVHAQLAADRLDIDAVTLGELVDDAAEIALVVEGAQPPIERVVGARLGFRGRAVEAAPGAVHDQRE